MDILPSFIIEDDDPVLLGKLTVSMETAVYHSMVDYHRRQNYRQHEVLQEPIQGTDEGYELTLPVNAGEFNFEEERLAKAFSGLNLMRRRILTLVFVEGLTARETADRLNCSVDYVYVQKHRAIKTLKDKLLRGDL